MRKITANIIFPVSSAPLNDAYLVLNDKGLVIDIVNYNRNQEEVEGLEYYSGILVPGFVNAHCHLELSHLKSDIGEGLGLKHFVKQVQKIRNKPPEIIERSIDTALRYMWSRGINGLADVVNSSVGLEQKKKSQIQIYNFIELFNESGKATDEILNYGNYIYTALTEANQVASFVPHSMYATNRELLKGICGLTLNDDIATMHFLESHWESNLVVDTIIGN
jgi:cytosine/adenosine deaminase-related metal-dependent hydrolase